MSYAPAAVGCARADAIPGRSSGAKFDMLAWETKSVEERSPRKPETDAPAGVLYQLAMAFPSWGSILLALYAILVVKFNAFRIGPR